MDLYFILKTLHILSATVLFGTGLGIAFFMFLSYFSSDIQLKLDAARKTVLADYLFTLPAVIIQPVSGIALIYITGYNWTDYWLTTTYALYILAGLCWIPVVWIQIQLKTICAQSVSEKTDLPPRYYTLFRIWFVLGWPAFIALVFIFYLMVAKPV